jgi:hypothetical protein
MLSQKQKDAALNGIREAADEITQGQTIDRDMTATAEALIEGIQFIKTQLGLKSLSIERTDYHPGADSEQTGKYDSIYIAIETQGVAATGNSRLAGMDIVKDNGGVSIKLQRADSETQKTYPATEENIAEILQRIGKQAALDKQNLSANPKQSRSESYSVGNIC